MRSTLNRVVHYYYLIALLVLTSVFFYGARHFWTQGTLNIEFVSGLYDGTNRVKAVKDRNDIDEIKKYVDSDRVKEAIKINSRLEQDIRELIAIKSTDDQKTFVENYNRTKVAIVNLQTVPELSTILATINSKVAIFESFVTEKKWPTLMRMSISLRNKTAQAKFVSSGLYNSDRVMGLGLSINNDIEAMTNFTNSTNLAGDIKQAIINRMMPIRKEVEALNSYLEEHRKFNSAYKSFHQDYVNWFKLVEPEIALKKIEFERGSQNLIFGIIILGILMAGSIVMGVVVYSLTKKVNTEKNDKLILETIRDELISNERKNAHQFSSTLDSELIKIREYLHKRMGFGTIFQEAMPFPTLLLDSNLNLIWGNDHFYDSFKLQNFREDDDSLTWDFLQRFTNLDDNSAILNALRMSTKGAYKIQIKTASMDKSIPYEMHVAPIDYLNQKRIMIVFLPQGELDYKINDQGNIIEQKNLEIQKLNYEIESLVSKIEDNRQSLSEVRSLAVHLFEDNRNTADEYNKFKMIVTNVIDTRDQMEEQFRFAINSCRELFKDQSKIVTAAEKSEFTVEDYIKSVKSITALKSEFKNLKLGVDDFKLRMVQVLDQVLVFQSTDGDGSKIDQFLGKVKFEIKGFEKILNDFNQVITQMDVTVTKMDMLTNDREKIDLMPLKLKMDSIKNNLDTAQFSVSKLTQNAHAKDEELVHALKVMVVKLKNDRRRVDELCKMTGLTKEALSVISPREL